MSVWRTQGFQTFGRSSFGTGFGQVDPGQSPGVENGAPPSSYAVVSLLDGEPGSVIRLVGLTLLRGCFIIPGMWVASKFVKGVDLEPIPLLALSFAGSTTITGGMIAYYAIQRAMAQGETR